jgi:hypothetical protein
MDETGLDLAGDAGYSAVGHKATFCKYILLDINTKLIVDYTILDKRRENGTYIQQSKFSNLCLVTSAALEPRACEQTIDKVIAEFGPNITSITTDRNASVINIIRRRGITSYLDIWHVTKNLRSKMRNVGYKTFTDPKLCIRNQIDWLVSAQLQRGFLK